ncbi:Crp/Fnr family transcriptional regulator [Levilactobacillus lanxiensis]|uniref:Crp/Fnr family transcriptional regulator n=2 Tax=Levilactobacillus lanxiensis TaxID=2799568 RepID=A0ABW4D0J0_9LACO|nr:Crp/Fnr family transcriptional regulator [Levilactobacillus lanxiensis]
MVAPAYLVQKFPEIGAHWAELQDLFVTKKVPAGTTLLAEGDVATEIFIITQGALRLWHNSAGKDVTLQFFFENQLVSSFESFYLGQPSGFSIESFEDTQVLMLSRAGANRIQQKYPAIEPAVTRFVCERFIAYRNIFFDQLQYSPVERYQKLATDAPEILDRVPLHLVASYLGMTPVSLSRIRTRLKAQD